MINLMNKELYYDQGFQITDNATFIVKGKKLYGVNKKYFEVYNTEKQSGFYVTSFI